MISLNNNWQFTPQWTQGFAHGLGQGLPIRLPHTNQELPLHCIDHNDYQMLCGYRRSLDIPEHYRGKRLFLQFDGAAHIATVFLNGQELTTHRCGYTSFRVDIADFVNYGGENLLAVRLDTTENAAIPPFGFVIDYLTYGGLYREVWLDIREQCYIDDIYVTTPLPDTIHVALKTVGSTHCLLTILDAEGHSLLTKETVCSTDLHLSNARLWCCDDPYRYTLRCQLLDDDGKVCDTRSIQFGIRTIHFRADGFYLNGKKTFLRGLNRHQSYPYVGYAAPERLQREDARILKEELGCNAVRTSHYPQSHHFIDECDRLGLLVFTEIPGWQHIGDSEWKKQACENVREMVMQYRNHPSIVLWGVRINESTDDDAFYRKTNAICHELDPSRPTSGVRYLEKSSLLEDVYSYNDFSHSGNNPGIRPKKKVSPSAKRAIIISEHNGHMFPTKAFDSWQKRQEQALRHARVLDDALASPDHAGCFGWCMFDYATHKDFGSGDRICYHGVLDSFRNPKLAAALYASQGHTPVLEIGSPMDIGDYSAGQLGSVWAFTNANQVRLYKNDHFVTTLCSRPWSGLPHGPMPVEDTIGCLLETQEHFHKKKADLLRTCLLSAGKYGIARMPLRDKLRMGYAMVRYKLTMADGVALYGKYVGNWGGTATAWRFDAVKDGQIVASVTKVPSAKLHLEVRASHTLLTEGNTYDMAAVRIRIVDDHGNLAPYAQLPVHFSLTGSATLVGPETTTAEGGMCGTYIRSSTPGQATLTITSAQTEPVTIVFTIQ